MLENTFKILSSDRESFVRFPENVERSARNEAVNKPLGLKRTLTYCKLQCLGLTMELFAFFLYTKKKGNAILRNKEFYSLLYSVTR